ncbi:MAG: flagellar protein FlaG [Nitrospiraceae bacterium]
MVQNIRPPQDPYVVPRQTVGDAKSIRDTNSSVGAGRETPTPVQPPTRDQVEQAAARVNEVLRGTTSRLEFEIDPDLNKVVIKILNGESGEIIRQIPSQELLDLAKDLDGPMGVLLREHA